MFSKDTYTGFPCFLEFSLKSNLFWPFIQDPLTRETWMLPIRMSKLFLCLAGVSAAGKKTHTCELWRMLCSCRIQLMAGHYADLEKCWPGYLPAWIHMDNISTCFQVKLLFLFPTQIDQCIMSLSFFNVNGPYTFQQVSQSELIGQRWGQRIDGDSVTRWNCWRMEFI